MTTDDNRPDPDALLAQVEAEDRKAQRGKLKAQRGGKAGLE